MCCYAGAILSLLGCLFYMTCAVMVSRGNAVFLEHKAGVDILDPNNQELIDWKYSRICTTALVSPSAL